MFWEKLCVNNNPPKIVSQFFESLLYFFQNVFLNFKVRYEKRLWTEFLNGNILCHSILKCLYFSLKCIMCNCFKSTFLVTKIFSFAFSIAQVAFFYFTWLPFHQLIFTIFSLLPSFHAHCLFKHLSFVCKWSSVRLVSNMSQMIILGVLPLETAWEVWPVPPHRAAVLHITVSHFVSRGVTMTAICKRSFSMCNSLFSGVPLVLYVNVLRERVWDGDDLAVKRAWNLYVCHLCIKLMLQRIAYK